MTPSDLVMEERMSETSQINPEVITSENKPEELDNIQIKENSNEKDE